MKCPECGWNGCRLIEREVYGEQYFEEYICTNKNCGCFFNINEQDIMEQENEAQRN